jgi:universal stress protein A
MAVYQRILLAVDLTADCLSMARRARAVATALDAELAIVHVVETVPAIAPIPPESAGPALVTMQAELLEAAQLQIARLGEELGVPKSRRSVLVGNTKIELLRMVTEGRFDLVVVGSRGRHGLAFFTEATGDALVHRATCDVLALRIA